MTELLTLDGISLAFGGLQALDDVSLSVHTGSIVGLIGPNGAGKTTLFNVVSGLLTADRGTISLAGVDVTSLSPPRRAALGIGRSLQNLGLVFEETSLTNVMAAQHLSAGYSGLDLALRPWRWWAAERRLRQEAIRALDAFGLEAAADTRVEDLSFAAARFVELACVLVRQPPLLLLDEPTTGLDPAEIDRLLAVLREQRSMGVTMLIVAHDVRFVMDLCDHVYVLAEGRTLFDGPPAQVQSHPAVIATYLGRSA